MTIMSAAAKPMPKKRAAIPSQKGASPASSTTPRNSAMVLGRSVDHTKLTICTDHAGCSEVGGLFLRADARAGGAMVSFV
jgi:hypothetical protein